MIAGGDLRAEVAERLARDADVRAQDREDLLDRLAAGVQAHHGRRRPSWNTSVLSQAQEPGTRPPRSAWWATVTANPSSWSPANDGLTTKTSGDVAGAVERGR